MIKEFGDRIFHIHVDDGFELLFGYNDRPLASAIVFKNFGGTDFFGIPKKSKSCVPEVTAIEWYETSAILNVGVMDESCAEYRLDPLLFK